MIRVTFVLRTPPDDGREHVLRMDSGVLATESNRLAILAMGHVDVAPPRTWSPVSTTPRVRRIVNSGLAHGRSRVRLTTPPLGGLFVLGHGQHLALMAIRGRPLQGLRHRRAYRRAYRRACGERDGQTGRGWHHRAKPRARWLRRSRTRRGELVGRGEQRPKSCGSRVVRASGAATGAGW